MPGFDGTGPRGEGPMTGWGRGYCVRPVNQPAAGQEQAAANAQNFQQPVYGVGRGGLPRGGGQGRAFGGGRGRFAPRRRWWW